MIEVEKKFQPTEEQLQELLEGAEFVGEKTMHDVYYDFSNYRIFKSGDRLRKRDSGFELKAYIPTESGVRVAHEYTDDKSILQNLNIEEKGISLSDLVATQMHAVCDYKTLRRKYKKGEFVIDVDSMDFDMNVIEIEILVENENQINEAEQKILRLAGVIGMEIKDLPLKTGMYLQKVKPEVFKEIFGSNIITD